MRTRVKSLLCQVFPLVLLIPLALAGAPDAERAEPPRFEGAWISSNHGEGGSGGLTTITSIGRGRYTVVSELVGPPGSALELDHSRYVGTARRTGARGAVFTLAAYMRGHDQSVIVTIVRRGRAVIAEDGTLWVEEFYGYYDTSQDPFGTEEPAYGVWGPFVSSAHRIEANIAPAD